jgi:hypothetical protein
MKRDFTLLALLISFISFGQINQAELLNEIEQIEKDMSLRIESYLETNPKALSEEQGRRLWDIINGNPIYIEDLNIRAA